MKQAPFRLLRGKLDFAPCRFSLSTRFMDPRYVMGSNLFYIYIYIYKAKNIVGSEDGPIIESPNSNIEFGIF